MKRIHTCLLSLQLFLSTTVLALLLSTTALAQVCRDSIIATAPSHYFTINNNGTVTDKRTQLIWAQCAVGQQYKKGQCIGSPQLLNYADTKKHRLLTHTADIKEWRLPTLVELSALVELSCNAPAINEAVFPGTASLSYWTNSRFVNKLKRHWLIQFHFGGNHVDKDTSLGLARFVHDASPKETLK